MFLVFVDTEEEFDWARPPSRENTSTSHVPAIADGHRRLVDGGARPVYLVDWPIAVDPRACELLGGRAAAGECEIGLQLHPWVNPPFDETDHPFNSFAGNLPPQLEEGKLSALQAAVTESFGVRPLCYRAGRYGVGPNTGAILERLNIKADVSVRSGFSYRQEGGPDFRQHRRGVYWAGPNRRVLEVPLGVAHLGRLGRWMPRALSRLAEGSLRGLLARAGLFARVPLSPEGTTVHEALDAIDRLAEARAPVLSFSFHSPSFEPGHTPYVRTHVDLVRFWRWWDAVFGRLSHHGIAGTGIAAVLEAVEGSNPPARLSAERAVGYQQPGGPVAQR